MVALLASLISTGFAPPSVADVLQDAGGDTEASDAALATSLVEGRFRLLLVLDEAPGELTALVG